MADFASVPMKDPKGYLDPEQVNSLLDATTNLRDRLILQIMYRCGRRVSEVLLMEVGDILWNDRKIIFRILKRKKPVFELKPVDEGTFKLLEIYVNNLAELKGVRKKPVILDEEKAKLLSEEQRQKVKLFPITRQYVHKLVRKLGKQVGIERIGNKGLHPHHFRHSFAVHAVRTTVKSAEDLRKLQMYMGHANMSTTAHYLQFSPEEMRDMITGMWDTKAKSENINKFIKKKEEK